MSIDELLALVNRIALFRLNEEDADALRRGIVALGESRDRYQLALEEEHEMHADAIKDRDALRAENAELKAKLAKIEHVAWHLLDDSEEDMERGAVTVDPATAAELGALLPEDHPLSHLK